MAKQLNKKRQENYQIYGLNGCANIIDTNNLTILHIDIMIDGNAEKKNWVKKIIRSKIYPINRLSKNIFLKKYHGKRTQGIVISFQGDIIKDLKSFKELEKQQCLLVIDGLEDPQNLGQIIRTAECANVTGILLPEHQSVQLTNAVLQVSQGAFVHLSIYRCGNLHLQLRSLKKEGYWVIGVENNVKAKSWCDFDYNKNLVLVMGSEGRGIRPIILKICDDLITIPMLGKINSLNVSSATSVILFERLRQLKFR